MIVFGDSFAVGSRLPYEETWFASLERRNDQLEIVNFGVDGYGTGQSYLRYKLIRDQIDYDYVLLMLVPHADLWRDINTRRDVGGNWPAYAVMPRFIVEDQELVLVPGPFANLQSAEFADEDDWNPVLRQHLRTYDRFYLPTKYEETPIIRGSVVYKLVAAGYSELRLRNLRNGLLDVDSEAMTVTKRIIRAMHSDVESHGERFVLVLLPVRGRTATQPHWRAWEQMVANLCESGVWCIDLAEQLLEIPGENIDTGYDGTHFGPNASRVIAELIQDGLASGGMLSPKSRKRQ
jgi:hypothetical protein